MSEVCLKCVSTELHHLEGMDGYVCKKCWEFHEIYHKPLNAFDRWLFRKEASR